MKLRSVDKFYTLIVTLYVIIGLNNCDEIKKENVTIGFMTSFKFGIGKI